MKFVIVQVAKQYITVTPAETGKIAPSATYSKLTKTDVMVSFDATTIHSLPDNLIDKALDYPKELAAHVKNSLLAGNLQVKDVILVAEGSCFIAQEYQHAKVKAKYLASFANLELQSIVNDGAQNYSMINCEYESDLNNVGNETQLNACLFAFNKSLAQEFKVAFEEQFLKLYKVIPPEFAIVKACQTSIVSYDKVVALFSIDYTALRVAVMDNGSIIYCHSFATAVSDIAAIIAKDKDIPIEEAVQLIRKTGFGIADQCNYSDNTEAIKELLEKTTSTIVRNLRMVLLGKRLELDQIYLCDALGTMPEIAKYLRQLGFNCEINNIADAFSNSTNVAHLLDSATEQGYKSSSFFTYTYLLNCGTAFQNNLLVNTSSKASGGVSVGLIASIIFAVATVGIVGYHAYASFALSQQALEDQQNLNSPKYTQIKDLLTKQENGKSQLANLKADKELLPQLYETAEQMMKTCFDEFVNNKKVTGVTSYKLTHETSTIDLVFNTNTFQDYIDLTDSVPKGEFFAIKKPFTATKNNDTNEFVYSVSLGIKKAMIAEEEELKKKAELEKQAAEAAAAEAAKEGK